MVMQLSQTANGGEVIWRAFENFLKLGSSFVVPAQVQERPAEGHSRG